MGLNARNARSVAAGPKDYSQADRQRRRKRAVDRCPLLRCTPPGALRRTRVELWTIDIDQQKAIWGSPDRHITCDALDLARYLAAETFDAVILNGFSGTGSMTRAQRIACFGSIATVMNPGGRLVIGWNHDKITNPTAQPAIKDLFPPCAFLDGTVHLALEGSTMIMIFSREADGISTGYSRRNARGRTNRICAI
jgi:hypothetical protein